MLKTKPSKICTALASEITERPPSNKLINLRMLLKGRLITEGYLLDQADELAEAWFDRLNNELVSSLTNWTQIGLPSPLAASGSPDTFITHLHPLYEDITQQYFPKDYNKYFNLLEEIDDKRFLYISACMLYDVGCNPIYITDRTNDGGVDCIGAVASGPARSLCIFLQAKTSVNKIPKSVLQLEHRKFTDLHGSVLMNDYLAALGKLASPDGCSISYGITSNNEFEGPARAYGTNHRFLIRSRRQIAYWLSCKYKYDSFSDIVSTCLEYTKYSLSTNLAESISNIETRNAE